jgi:3-methylcrotonyl-CoA carboxylase alpha subunit
MDRIYRQGEATLKVTARRDGAKLHVQSPAGEHEYEWDELGPGDYLLRANGHQRRCIVARAGDDRWVWVDGHIHHLKVESAGRRRSAHPAGELVSPMPGQVVRVLVAPGDTVRKAQVLVVLEAMKMQVEIAAPRDGVVRAVHASVGVQVTGGVALVTLEDDTEGKPA